MRRAAAAGLLILGFAALTYCGPDSSVKTGPGGVLLDLLPRSTTSVFVLDVQRLLKIDAVARAMEAPGSLGRIFGQFKAIGIDPRKDISCVGWGIPSSEWWRRFLLGRQTREAIIESVSFVVALGYDSSRLQALIRARSPVIREDPYNGVTIYANPFGNESQNWMRLALLNGPWFVFGSDKGVKAVIDVSQKKAQPLSKSPEMSTLIKQVDRSGLCWLAASFPAELFREIAASNPELADLEWLKGLTWALDEKDSRLAADFRSLGGTREQNAAAAAHLTALAAYGSIHFANEPALAELFDATNVTSGKDHVRLTASVSPETIGQLWRLAMAMVEERPTDGKLMPQERDPGAIGSARGLEVGTDAAYRERILAQAEDMHRAIMSGDLDRFITYMLPQIIAGAGGAEALKRSIQPTVAEMPRLVEKITIGKISPIVSEQDGLAAFVPIEMDYRIKGTRLIQMSYYVAFSTDSGGSWTFMSSQGQPKQDQIVRQLFPRLAGQMALPKCGQFVPFWE